MSLAWFAGPHERFGELGPTRLARESLAWFEESDEGVNWRGHSTARLELEYPCGDLEITVRHEPAWGLSWEEQLRAWFERFPPGGSGSSDLGREQYFWRIELGDRGRVAGVAASDPEAIGAMKSLCSDRDLTAIFRQPTFSLTFAVRRSSHEMDCYSEEAEGVEGLDELPRRVSEKVATYASMR